MATINNIRVQREILDASHQEIDIGTSYAASETYLANYEAKLAPHRARLTTYKTELAFYNSTYDAMISGEITMEQARHDIGQTYGQKQTSNTPKKYKDYYGGWCDARIAHKGNP